MDVELITSCADPESYLSLSVLETPTDPIETGLIYGGGEWWPGYNFDRFLDAYRRHRLLGIFGLCITEESVVNWSTDLRERIGGILKLAPHIYVTDSLSVEWALHYGVTARNGGNLAWLAEPRTIDNVREDRKGAATSVGEAIACARRGDPVVLWVKDRTGWGITAVYGQPMVYHPLVRFAKEHGLSERLCFFEDEVKQKLKGATPIPQETVERAISTVRVNLEALLDTRKQATPANAEEKLDMVLGGRPVSEVGGDGPRTLELGSVFNPATHYTEHYYDSTKGILYTTPSGEKQIYFGPNAQWEGNTVVVEILDAIIPKEHERKVLDIGCSAGDFVHKALRAGWQAYGVDLSADAAARAHPDVQDRIITSDITRPTPGLAKHAPYSVITSWDVCEHLYLRDIDGVIEGMRELQPPGGLAFHIICTRGQGEKDWTIEPGQVVTTDNAWLLVSGHLTIRRWHWWAQQFAKHGYRIRHDLHSLFQIARAESPGFSTSLSWSARNFIALERL